MHFCNSGRRCRHGLAALLLAAFLAVLPVRGRAADTAQVDSFTAGNMIFFFYHELGHALVAEFGIPVLGKEEDAVDQLATLLMLESYQADPSAAEYLSAATKGWLVSWEQLNTGKVEDLPMWDEHSLDIQRFYGMVCLMYGADPKAFGDLAKEAGLPDERAANCADEYQAALANWGAVLEPYLLPEDGKRPEGLGGRLALAYADPRDPAYAPMRTALAENGFLDAAVEDINGSIGLPKDIPVSVEECGVENAFWDPQAERIVICYELVQWYAQVPTN